MSPILPLRRASALLLASALTLGMATTGSPSPAGATPAAGFGSVSATPGAVAQGDTGVTLQFIYTVDGQHPLSSGEVDVTVPAGWTPPTTTPTSLPNDAGHVTASTGTVTVVAGQGGTSIIEVKGVTLTAGTLTISYGDKTAVVPGPGLSITEAPGSYSFPVAVATDAVSTPAPITAATVGVGSPNGSGTTAITSQTQERAVAGSTGNNLSFSYTPPVNGALFNGRVVIPVAAGWSAPTSSTSAGAVGVVGATAGTAAASGRNIVVTGLTLGGAGHPASVTITYSNATAPSGPQSSTFGPVQEASVAGDSPAPTASTPTIPVAAADGTGTVTVAPSVVSAGSSVTETFTVTAAAGGMQGGEVDLTVPAGWTAPSTSAGNPGFTDVGAGGSGAVSAVSGPDQSGAYTVKVTGITLAAGKTTTIVYGDSGHPATSPTVTGATSNFGVAESSVPVANGGQLTALPAAPVRTVGQDGKGTMTVSPATAPANSGGNDFTFTFTPPDGGMDHGIVTIANPQGWPKPTVSPGQPGSVSSTQGAISVDQNTNAIVVSGLTRPAGTSGQVIITYSNVTTPNLGQDGAFTTSEASSATGALTALAAGGQPTVALTAANGSGSMTVDTPFVGAGTTTSLTFTYTAPSGAGGGLNAGEIDLTVPTGWTAPQTAAGSGQATASTGSVAVAGSTIRVTGVSLQPSHTMTITYANATAPTAQSPGETFVAASAPNGGAPSELASGSPKVAVAAEPGSGSMTVTPTMVINGSSGNNLNFLYTAATGGLIGGEVDVIVPSGWTAPQMTNSFGSGFVTVTTGTLNVVGNTIKVTGLNFAAGDQLGISYQSAGAPSSNGPFPFDTKDSSDPSKGTVLTELTTGQPTVQVITNAPDGTGSVIPGTQSASAGNTATRLTWVYSAALGGLANGEVDLAIPPGWTAPSTNGGAGAVTASIAAGDCAPAGNQTCSVSVSQASPTQPFVVHVTGLTLAQNATLTLTYAGITVPDTPGMTVPFTVSEQSTPGGTMTALPDNAQPVVDITAADGTGSAGISPTVVSATSSGLTLAITYTQDQAGGMEDGEVDVVVPTGWTPPATGTASSPGAVAVTQGSGTITVSGRTIEVQGVTLAAGGTLGLSYSNVTAPATVGQSRFSVNQSSSGTGTPAYVGDAHSPTVTVTSADGSGTAVVTPNNAAAGDTGRTFTITYTPVAGGLIDGTVDVAVPAGWPTPTTAPGQADTVTASSGAASVDPDTGDIVVTGLTIGGPNQPTDLLITYGAGGGDTGVTVPAQTGAAQFTVGEASANGDQLATVTQGDQTVNVAAANGSGTMTVSPQNTPSGATGQSFTFTYTAAAGGLVGGEVDLVVPTGWTAPSTASGTHGFTTATGGTTTPSVTTSGQTVRATNVTLAGGTTLTVVYGSGTGGGVTVGSSPGAAATFTASEASVSDDVVKALAASPSVNVVAPDGGGTMTASPADVLAGSATEIDLTYTAPAGGLAGGEVDVTVPSGWTPAPQTSSVMPGYTTSSAGTLTAVNNTIEVKGVTLPKDGTLTIRYGAPRTAPPGPSATAPTSAVVSTFNAASSATGATPVALAASPTVDVIQPAADGTGTISVSPTTPVAAGSTGHTLTLTYTPDTGGTLNGEVDVTVPAGWTPPSTAAGHPGLTTVNTGTVAVNGQTISVSGLDLGSGNTPQLTITYGSGGGNTGVTIPSSPTGAATFSTTEKSTGSGTAAALPDQSITVVAADGSGTASVSPASVLNGSTHTLTFTYTPAAGGTSGGEVDIAVPATWTGGTPGSSAGTPSYHNGTLAVTGLSATSAVTITLSGVTAPSSPTTSTFAVSEASAPGDAPVALASSPTVSVTGAPTAGVSPAQLDFGAVKRGTTSQAQSVTVSNSGTAPMHVTAVSTAAPFQVTGGTCAGATLNPQASCTVTVVFSPSAVGHATGLLDVSDDAAGSPHTVSLSGDGTARSGYWMVGTDASVYNFGDASNYGNPAAALPAGAHAVHIEPAPDGNGYWVLADSGTVYPFGSAASLGNAPALPAGEHPSSLSATPSGHGYWIFTDRGRALPFGDATSFGDMSGRPLNGPIVDSVATPSGGGYYMVGSDGGIFAFGDAQFYGSMGGQHLNRPVVGLAPTPTGAGYWLLASDGGIFAFGDAQFRGSMGDKHLNQPVIGAVAYGDGYLMVASDGGIFDFSDKAYTGSLGNNPPSHPIVGVAVLNQ